MPGKKGPELIRPAGNSQIIPSRYGERWNQFILLQLAVVLLILSIFSVSLKTFSASRELLSTASNTNGSQEIPITIEEIKSVVEEKLQSLPNAQDGLDGADGVDGRDGNNGDKGTSPPATNAENGQSAYELWLSQGNAGTEQDFLNSLVGSTGPQGVSGDTGPPGQSVELRQDVLTGDLEWRYEGDSLWTKLLENCVLTNSCLP